MFVALCRRCFFPTVACTLVLSAPVLGAIDAQIDANPKLSSYRAELGTPGRDVLRALIAREQELRRMPSLTEFCRHMVDRKHPVTQRDYDLLFFLFTQVQAKPVSAMQLSTIISASRRSITTFRAFYTVTTNEPKDGMRVRECEFAMDRPKLLYTYTERRSQNSEPIVLLKMSQGQEIARYFQKSPKSLGVAGIGDPIGRRYYFDDGNPLLSAMLIDSLADLGSREVSHDLAAFAKMSCVYETPERAEGRDCLVVGSPERFYFVDPNLGYALIGANIDRFSFDEEEGRLKENPSYILQSNVDFVDCGNGLHLPKRVKVTQERTGNPSLVFSAVVAKMEVNGELDKGTFDGIIPRGTMVSDGKRNAVYPEGYDESVQNNAESALRGLKLDGRQRVGWFVAANVVGGIALVAVRYLRRAKYA